VVPDRRVQFPIKDSSRAPLGREINAFRVLEEVADSYFLDFIHFSAHTQRAVVVQRIRVQRAALESVRDRLRNDLTDVGAWASRSSGRVTTGR
jgi:hypothetical protein